MSIPRIGPGAELTISPSEIGLEGAGMSGTSGTTGAGAPDFAAILERQVADASHLQQVASAKTDALARGASDDLHGTMISVKEAEISMKLVGTVRNRLLDAFHELWRINL